MKKLLFTLLALVMTMGIQAQTIHIMKTINGKESEDTSFTNTNTETYRAVLSRGKAIYSTGVTVNPSNLGVVEGKTATLTATVIPDYATDRTVTWESLDPKIATVDAKGVVTGVSAGTTGVATATIRAKAHDGKGGSATCTVKVTNIAFLKTVADSLGIPLCNLAAAYEIDPNIVKSFDGTGRWIKNDKIGNYFDTGYYHTSATWVDIKFIYTTLYNYNTIYGSGTTDNGVDSFNFGCTEAGYANVDLGCGIVGYSTWSFTAGSEHEVLFGPVTSTLDGTNVWNHYKTFNACTKYCDAIFTRHENGSFTSELGDAKIAFVRIYEGTTGDKENSTLKHYYIPIVKNHVNTMVDLMSDPTTSAAWPTQNGTFTIE